MRVTFTPPIERDGYLLVRSAADLPAAVANLRTLPANTLVEIAGLIDLGADALVLSAGTAIRGLNPGGDGIMTTNTGGAVRADVSVGQVILREFFIVSPAGPALALAGPITAHCNLFFVGFLGCASIGTITGFKVGALEYCYCGPAGVTMPGGGVTFAGTTSKVFVFGCPFEDLSAGSAITLAADLVADVVDIAHSFFKFDAPGVGMTITPGATVARGLFSSNLFPVANTVTPLVGVTPAAVNWVMGDNSGLRDSRILGMLYLTATALTAIALVNTPVKLLGTTTADTLNERLAHTNNRLTYSGESLAAVQVTATISLDAANNNKLFTCYIAKNGAVLPASAAVAFTSVGADVRALVSTAIVELAQGDYVEAWVGNNTDDTDVTAVVMTLAVR